MVSPCQCGMGFRKRAIQLKCLLSSFFGFRVCVTRRQELPSTENQIAIGETCISECIDWISLDGLREISACLRYTCLCSLVPFVATFEVKLVRLWVRC